MAGHLNPRRPAVCVSTPGSDMTSEDETLYGIVRADMAATAPIPVYYGDLDGPGSEQVVVPRPAESIILIYPAGTDDNGQVYAGRPHGDMIGISDTSVEDALNDARNRPTN